MSGSERTRGDRPARILDPVTPNMLNLTDLIAQ